MEENTNQTSKTTIVKHSSEAGGGMVYILGAVGAAIYYIQDAADLGDGVMGVLKALIWPVLLVYHALQFLHM